MVRDIPGARQVYTYDLELGPDSYLAFRLQNKQALARVLRSWCEYTGLTKLVCPSSLAEPQPLGIENVRKGKR